MIARRPRSPASPWSRSSRAGDLGPLGADDTAAELEGLAAARPAGELYPRRLVMMWGVRPSVGASRFRARSAGTRVESGARGSVAPKVVGRVAGVLVGKLDPGRTRDLCNPGRFAEDAPRLAELEILAELLTVTARPAAAAIAELEVLAAHVVTLPAAVPRPA